MTEYTLLKLQVDDATFTAYAPFSGAGDVSDERSNGDGDSPAGDGVRTVDDGASGGGSARKLLGLVVGLLFLVAVAVAVKKFRDDGDT